MTAIPIADDLARSFAEAAAERGCNPGELASAILHNWMRDQTMELTAVQDAALRGRLAHPEDGGFLSSEDVDVKFDTLFRELNAR